MWVPGVWGSREAVMLAYASRFACLPLPECSSVVGDFADLPAGSGLMGLWRGEERVYPGINGAQVAVSCSLRCSDALPEPA